jgi:prepilin-type N-terminal cleavage/methylation domain-containing protein
MSNRTKSYSGFTLIELLVVIAIIGILAALVLVALGNARQKASDARIKSDLGQLRTMGEVYYDANNASYAGFETCSDGTCNAGGAAFSGAADVGTLVTDVTTAAGVAPVINAVAQEFCVSSRLASDNAIITCVDSGGTFSDNGACPASGICP